MPRTYPSRRKQGQPPIELPAVSHAQIHGDWTFEVYEPSEQGEEVFEFWSYDENGDWGLVDQQRFFRKQVVAVRNMIVNTGLDYIRRRVFDSLNPSSDIDQMQFIAIGTGSTAVSATDTTLQTELVRESVDTYTSGGTGVCTVSTTFGAGIGTGTITEAGIFDLDASGTMFARTVFTGVAKGASDILKVSATFTFTSV